ncbi:tetratricopeptide repeat protein [Myroides odoratus]|uniref:tetratricopeptide repeat protein n=1 Tax=Myroides odoratus TaxID=256 RepID=UPI0039AFA5EE
MKYHLFIFLFLFLGQVTQAQTLLAAPQLTASQKAEQDRIIATYATNKAHHYNYNLEMNKWQAALDEGLAQDSTIAYLWQQKAMPYFKSRKYEVGMAYLDKAVQYDSKRYLPYRAFIKCIFSKTYREAIRDFETCLAQGGDSYEMDHTYTFYLGLSHLQLNEFDKAEAYLLQAVARQREIFPEVHHLDLFYLGIVCYEQERYHEAIVYFDQAIAGYKEFSEAYYYKALCQLKEQDEASAKQAFALYRDYSQKGFFMDEANAIYELYPYQLSK